MKVNKSMRPVVKLAESLGYRVDKTNGGHLRFLKPGRRPLFTSSTPSDWRSQRNIMSELRRNEGGAQ